MSDTESISTESSSASGSSSSSLISFENFGVLDQICVEPAELNCLASFNKGDKKRKYNVRLLNFSQSVIAFKIKATSRLVIFLTW